MNRRERTSAILILLLLCATLTTWFLVPLNYGTWKKNFPVLKRRETSFGSSISENWKKENIAEATFYTKECGTGDGITFTGTEATVGRTVAVDPAVIPLGSWLYIQGIGWRKAEDTGSAVRGNIIDIYVGEGEKARHEALRAGRRQVKILYREARA
jgi:3D (Asp-Asp-Asp) domain-containing protein